MAIVRLWRHGDGCVSALAALVGVIVAGTVGYIALGFPWLDALYQTVTTVATVGFREVQPLIAGGQVFTIVLILVGVGTALYTFTLVLEVVVEGHVQEVLGRRRMEREIARMSDHVIVCGFGRVGRNLAQYVTGAGHDVVVIENDPARAAAAEGSAHVVRGDATTDEVLKEAGIERARVLVTALNTDADNLFVTLTARSLRPDLFIVARARVESSEAKLTQAGADRVVNPQGIGGARMAAFVLQPHVAEFLDVVMHDGSLEFRLEEIPLPRESPLAGQVAAGRPHPGLHRGADPGAARRRRRVHHQPATRDRAVCRPDPHRHRDRRPAAERWPSRPLERGNGRSG